MRTTLIEESKHELHDMLLARGVAKRRAIQLQNLMVHCGYQSYAIDCPMDAIKECDMVIATTEIPSDMLHQMALAACQAKITLCILSPTADSKRDKMCRKIVEEHLCTSVDNRAYLLIFNNHLPKQKFRL